MKFNDQQMIRMGQLLNAVGIVLILLPFGNALLPVGLVVAGLGCAPIYPASFTRRRPTSARISACQ